MKNNINAILFGWRIADKIIKKNPGKKMIFTEESIGDQCVELAYAGMYKKVHGIKHLGVITSNPNHAVFQYFKDQYDSLIKVTKSEIRSLLQFYKSDLGQMYRKKHPEILCAFYTAFVRYDLLSRNPYAIWPDIEKMIYRIPLNTVPCNIKELPCEVWLDKLEARGVIEAGKTVLINPYANSITGVPISFFKELAIHITEKGYKVVAAKNRTHHKFDKLEWGEKTVTLDYPLEKAVALANRCGFVIGIRSGFLDLCAFSKAKVVAVAEPSYPFMESTELENWWPQNRYIRTFIFNKDEDTLGQILDYMENA